MLTPIEVREIVARVRALRPAKTEKPSEDLLLRPAPVVAVDAQGDARSDLDAMLSLLQRVPRLVVRVKLQLGGTLQPFSAYTCHPPDCIVPLLEALR